MFDFFQNIFDKVVLLMASVIVAIGFVSAPEVPEQPLPPERIKEEITVEAVPEIQPERRPEPKPGVDKQYQAEIRALEEKRVQADKKIELLKKQAELEEQKIREQEEANRKAVEEEKRLKAEAEEARKQAEVEEAQRQEQLKKQAELEKKIAEEYEAQRKVEEEQAQQEYEAQLGREIEADTNYFSSQISVLEQDIEQTASGYRASMNREQSDYLNDIEFYAGLYKLDIISRHRAILNEASKGIWTDCTELRRLWDYQNGDYQQYSIGLNGAERTLRSDIGYVASSYVPDLNFFLNQVKNSQQKLSQYLAELNNLSVPNVGLLKNEVNNLISRLNSLEPKINEAKSYSVSVPPPSSFLSEIDPLIEEEKAWFAKTSCRNLP